MTLPNHPFILSTGTWLGEGKIAFSASSEALNFYTKWSIPSYDVNEKPVVHLDVMQDVEMVGADERIKNNFTFYKVGDRSFEVRLENDLIGIVNGVGVIDGNRIAWEFRGHPNFEGFEVYELQKNGEYKFHAEYVSPDQFRSVIDGRIWKKA